jgi:tetratricopeptide (TPR) repeat protein
MKRIIIFMLAGLLIFSSAGYCQDQNNFASAKSISKKELIKIKKHKKSRSLENEKEEKPIAISVNDVVNGLVNMENPDTKLAPSHFAHPGYENLAFLYDKTVDAIFLKIAGHQDKAEEILDYFAGCLRIPIDEVYQNLDTNRVYGIVKIFKNKITGQKVKTLINSIDVSSKRKQGKGILEFWTTPGPMAFLVFAFLQVNPEKYKKDAIAIGDVLLSMQAEDGGITDGDRSPDRVHTEPHMDGYAAFLMLYQITGDEKWKVAADKAFYWFKEKVLHQKEGIIDQGVWSDLRSTIFAEDVYSWSMAGPAGDKIPLDVIKRLTKTVLSKSLVKITVKLPDESVRTFVLVDFSDANEPQVKANRGGYRPMGSVEWTGGAILALEKNAVRLWNEGDAGTAKFYKAIAEILQKEALNTFYWLDTVKGATTFYATGQGINVGPFGSIGTHVLQGWKTPFFLVKTKDDFSFVKGGSPIGVWAYFPYFGMNPFILNDGYKKTYDFILAEKSDFQKAHKFIDEIVAARTYNEITPLHAPEANAQIVEPGYYNVNMWDSMIRANIAKNKGNDEEAKAYYMDAIRWAQEIVDNKLWFRFAKRDNKIKDKEIGGIISYPWGVTFPKNENPLHYEILRYPLLNEVGTAVWALSVLYFKLGDIERAKHWMRILIKDFPYHQIADTVPNPDTGKRDLIRGYWNALISWEDNDGNNPLDAEMGILYREILKEMDIRTARPQIIALDNVYKYDPGLSPQSEVQDGKESTLYKVMGQLQKMPATPKMKNK